jgi:hypothetical protein
MVYRYEVNKICAILQDLLLTVYTMHFNSRSHHLAQETWGAITKRSPLAVNTALAVFARHRRSHRQMRLRISYRSVFFTKIGRCFKGDPDPAFENSACLYFQHGRSLFTFLAQAGDIETSYPTPEK